MSPELIKEIKDAWDVAMESEHGARTQFVLDMVPSLCAALRAAWTERDALKKQAAGICPRCMEPGAMCMRCC